MLAQVLNPSIWRGLSHTLTWARHQLGKPIISSAAPAAAATLISVLHVFSVLAGYRVGGIAQPQWMASGHIICRLDHAIACPNRHNYAEPAPRLPPPETASEKEDGLLTASSSGGDAL